ncbi:MAG: hypothetical protein HY077_16150 [Elusimicrobia bacterium]|nr:hypothetical protein [Elusimicrobiota bacterium]
MNKTLLAAFILSAPAVWARGGAMDLLRAASYDASAEGGLEKRSAQAGAAFQGGRVPTRPSLTSEGSASGLALSSKAKASTAPAESVPPPPGLEHHDLKLIRAGGIAVAAAGVGLMAYAVAAAAAGPIGWAAAAIFFGGLSAYLAHRRLQGKDDFKHA